MAHHEALTSPAAAPPIGPYSHAVRCGDLLFVSGQLPADPATGALVEGGAGAQAARVLENLRVLLESLDSGLPHVLKTTVFLTDMDDFAEVNEVYARYFSQAPPARSCVAVAALPKGARVEMDCIAALGE
ncbi:MAG TPA: RidA family protein [Armatimonadota bacterium]|nr:RidA family protein [Armatimonadota bacterium]HQK92517.1 RidA family protein [Armatimonadota bacterium]